MEEIEARHLVYRQKSQWWFGTTYNLNIYRGCSHGCIYCDSRSDCYQVGDFDRVRAKADALRLIESDLRSKRQSGVVATGAMSDPYNPQEARALLTQGALGLLDQYRFGLAVATKSDLVVRDIPYLQKINVHSPVLIKMTITTPHDALSAKLEPHAPSSSRRFAAIKALSDAGIYTGILLMPVVPFLEDTPEDIELLVEKAAESGAKFIYPYMGMTMRDGQREYFYQAVERLWPGLKERYQRQYGLDYQCNCPGWRQLLAQFQKACKAHGLLYRMKEIVAAYQGPTQIEQLRLF